MRSLLSLAVFAAVILFSTSGSTFADDEDHFRKFKVPSDEARILALTGVREFRCDYEVMPSPSLQQNIQGSQFNYQQDLQLFAELYQGTTCVGRYRLAFSVNAFHDLNTPLKGILSFGWNHEKHELISVIDNEQLYTPWTATLVLMDFSYVDYFFFENSTPEKRSSRYDSGEFEVYPVVGICGDRNFKINYSAETDAASFLKDCEHSRAKNAIVIYLYKSSGGGPPLKFDESSPTDNVLYFYRYWFANRLSFAIALAVILFLVYWFVILPKRGNKKAN